jgi:hypothetical protein
LIFLLIKGIYGEKNVPPTFTKFKFFEKINGNSSTINGKSMGSNSESMLSFENQAERKFSSFEILNTVFFYFMEEGIWYFSLLSDNQYEIQFTLKTEIQGKKFA